MRRSIKKEHELHKNITALTNLRGFCILIVEVKIKSQDFFINLKN